jgi:hypothetical protein
MTTEVQYTPIKAEFRKDKFDFTLVARRGDWCVYSKTKTGFKSTFYEVMRIRRHEGRIMGGQNIPPSEYLPCNEAWGIDGFSFSKRELALKHLDTLCQKP